MGAETILIVDDELALVQQCSEILVAEGYRVQGALGGEQALALLDERSFDLLLVDLKMPRVDGLQVLRHARGRDPGPVAVAMTAYGTMENAVEALRAGAREFLLKPFDLDELLAVVERALAVQRLERENLLLRAQMPILEISQALMTRGSVDFLAAQLLEIVAQQVGAGRAWLLLLDEERNELYVVSTVGLPDEAETKIRIPSESGLAGEALQGEEPLVLDLQVSAAQDPTWTALASGVAPAAGKVEDWWGAAHPPGQVVYLPLRTAQRIMGLAVLDREQGAARFTAADLNLLAIVGNQVAIALENAHLYETVARMFEQVRNNRERLRRLAQRVVTAQEEERQRLSRELHDEAGQALTALKLSLELIKEDLPQEATSLRQRMGEAVDLTDETMERIRLLAQDLRPPALDAVGLNLALEGYCRDFAGRTGLALDYKGTDLPELSNAVRTSLYRLLQEALTNVAKHASARRVRVDLSYDAETIRLAVTDDGQGFDPLARLSGDEPTAGIGLLGMQERLEVLNGWLEISAEAGQGTDLVAYIPWRQGP